MRAETEVLDGMERNMSERAAAPIAELAVATSLEVSSRIGVAPSLAQLVANELGDVFTAGTAPHAEAQAHNCRESDDGSPTPLHLYV